MSRPEAPLIPAMVELLEGWCGPVVHRRNGEPTLMPALRGPLVWMEGQLIAGFDWVEMGPCEDSDLYVPDLLLDLRRPEVACRVREAVARRLGLDDVEHGVQFVPWDDGVYLLRAGSDLPFAANAEWYGGSAGVHVPALADLPEEHRDAWALWHCWAVTHGR